MKIYARIQEGVVVEIFPPVQIDGIDIPLEERIHPEMLATCIDISDISPSPTEWWEYVDGVFIAPKDNTPSTQEQLEKQRTQLINEAKLSMVPVLVSLQLGEATESEIANAASWQTYYRSLQDLDTSAKNIVWPQAPE